MVAFSLIELMLTIAIIGILAVVAIPSYSDYIVRAKRAEAKDMLSEIMFQQERYYVRNGTYVDDMTSLGYASDPITTEEGNYNIDGTACSGSTLATCVTLTASPASGSSQSSDGNLSLDSRGNRAPADKWSK